MNDKVQPHVIVTGGRTYGDREHVWRVLDEEDPILVVQGGAKGADALAFEWAEKHGVACATFHAWWNTFGKSAGGRRNGWMLMFAPVDLVIAFPGGSGTQNMINRTIAAGVPLRDERARCALTGERR
jgi:hypothetical protein